MVKPKGGRGYKAPYESHQVRVPDPIAVQVHNLIERYQEYIANGGNPDSPPQFLDQTATPLEAILLIRHAVTAPNGTNKGEKGYQAKSFSKGIEDIRQALILLEQSQNG